MIHLLQHLETTSWRFLCGSGSSFPYTWSFLSWDILPVVADGYIWRYLIEEVVASHCMGKVLRSCIWCRESRWMLVPWESVQDMPSPEENILQTTTFKLFHTSHRGLDTNKFEEQNFWKITNFLLLIIIASWIHTHKCTALAVYTSKMTLTMAQALPCVTLVYWVLGSFYMLDCVCVEPGCVPSSEYAFKKSIISNNRYGFQLNLYY